VAPVKPSFLPQAQGPGLLGPLPEILLAQLLLLAKAVLALVLAGGLAALAGATPLLLLGGATELARRWAASQNALLDRLATDRSSLAAPASPKSASAPASALGLRPALLGERLSAWLTDTTVVAIPWAALLYLLLDEVTEALLAAHGPLVSPVLGALRLVAQPLLAALPGVPPALGFGPEGALALVVAFALWPSLAVPYYTLFETLFGRTPGKAARDLGVVTASGARPGPRAAFLRAVTRYADGVPLGAAGLLTTLAAGRRLGDLLAGTDVVALRARATGGRRDRTALRGHRLAGLLLGRDDEARETSDREGERAVRKELYKLTEWGWVFFFNAEHPALGDIDCIALGPHGVFVVKVKGHAGTVTSDPTTGELLRDGAPFEKDFHAQLARQVEHLQGVLDPAGGVAGFLCFSRATVGTNRRGELPFATLPLKYLTRELTHGPRILWPFDATDLAREVGRVYGVPQHGHGPREGTVHWP
jgi:uncharacterized RDD family membrane protein YckC